MTRAGRDRGSLSPFVAIVIVAVVAFVGLTVDGTGRLRAIARADHVAAEAARAGGQAINLQLAIVGDNLELDPHQALAAAYDYLNTAGADPSSRVSISADDLHVTVVAVMVYQPQFLGSFGFGSNRVSATVTANVISQ
jgi:hypothetical protein